MSRGVLEFSCFCCLPPLPTFFLLSVFYDPCFCLFFVIYFDREGEFGHEISCFEKIAAVQP